MAAPKYSRMEAVNNPAVVKKCLSPCAEDLKIRVCHCCVAFGVYPLRWFYWECGGFVPPHTQILQGLIFGYRRALLCGYLFETLNCWFRRKVYRSIGEIQLDLDTWLRQYNNERTHFGNYCYGKTSMRTFVGSIPMAKERLFGHDESDGRSV